MSQQAPLWAFVAEAIDGVGDTHLPAGIHVRALPSPRLGVPATPLVVTRSILTPDMIKRLSRASGVTWIDSHGATLTAPFAITADNPVYAYFPVPNVIFAELNATPGPGTIPIQPTAATAIANPTPAIPASLNDALRAARPIASSAPTRVDVDHLAEELKDQARLSLPPKNAGFVRFEALANSELGPAPFQMRATEPYALAAWTIPLVRVIGRGTVNGIQWLDAARVGEPEDPGLWEIWSLPLKRPAPRYTPTPNAPAEAEERIKGAAVQRQPLYVAYTDAAPESAPAATSADALDRVGQVRGEVDRWLDTLVNDLSRPPSELTDAQPISGAANGVATLPIEPFLIGGAVDPDLGHYLGFGDDDVKADAPQRSLVLYRVRGLWRWEPERWLKAEAFAFAAAIRANVDEAVKQFPELKKSGVTPSEKGPFVDLFANAVAYVGAPPSPPDPVSFDGAEDRGWLASPPPPNVRRALRLTASGFLPHAVAALAASDAGGDRTLNPYRRIGRFFPGLGPAPAGAPLPIVVSRPGDAIQPGLGRFEDRDAPEGAVLYRLAQGDWFGRWGPWRARNAAAKARTPPMRPTIELYPQPPAIGSPAPTGPLAGVVQVRVPIPRADDLPPGGAALVQLDLDETFAGSPTAASSYALAALPVGATIEPYLAPTHDVLVITRAGPALDPSTTRKAIYLARWIDDLGLVSPNSDPAIRTIVDPRPPPSPAVVTELRYTARPDARGHARVDLDFVSTPGARYRVYASTEPTLLKALDAAGRAAEAADIRGADPGAPRAMKFRAYRTLFGWDDFECLTKQSIIAAETTTRFVHRVSGSLNVLAIYRVIGEGESGALADLTQADLVPFAVPNLGGPPRPQASVINTGLDPTAHGARLRVKVPIGKASPKAWRLRRASVPTNDPLRMPIVGDGLVETVTTAPEGVSFEIDAPDPLKPWRQYRFAVEVQAADPPGAPTVGVLLPGEWSEASVPATLSVIPPKGPAAPSAVAIANDGGDLWITIQHPAAGSLVGSAMGPHRFELWRVEPGERPRQRNVLFTLDNSGQWVGSDAGAAASGAYATVRVIDPIGRRSDAAVSNVI